MLDHPVTQKVLAGVVGAGIIALGGLGWNTGVRVTEHEAEIRSMKEHQSTLGTTVVGKLEGIQADVGEIKTDVAVLKERTERLNASELNSVIRP